MRNRCLLVTHSPSVTASQVVTMSPPANRSMPTPTFLAERADRRGTELGAENVVDGPFFGHGVVLSGGDAARAPTGRGVDPTGDSHRC